ncbi:hypothetical protein BWZ20_11235 [Winogradskyella sp. J14-2]|uniref:carboxypeptidase-like regulatory domain-containing protein n=1 Tax=Winogradskyella sp. J14-2 TaxID=1936080 RepID=UPI0009726DC7|nr:carboxypeptidase-like regulatory domain-containing protein [Winogradskyella sp. J14-2]APY08837.1 hypothetical protein BWZ20_11235 [Winogradskyella sp. J14-2]
MKSTTLKVFVFLICIFFISSYNTDGNLKDQTNNTNTLTEYLGKPVEANFKGSVVNDNNEPLDSVTVTIGNQTVQTDAKGHFEIKNASAHDNFLPIAAQRKGYKNVILNLDPKSKDKHIDITLKKEGTSCLFWFCEHNHNLSTSSN